MYAGEYFDRTNAQESAIRGAADAIFNRVDWNWMARGTNVLSMGWFPESGFIPNNWIGYNEAMLLYILGLGAATNPLPASAWQRWTSGYTWSTYYGYSYVPFAPLFGHQVLALLAGFSPHRRCLHERPQQQYSRIRAAPRWRSAPTALPIRSTGWATEATPGD